MPSLINFNSNYYRDVLCSVRLIRKSEEELADQRRANPNSSRLSENRRAFAREIQNPFYSSFYECKYSSHSAPVICRSPVRRRTRSGPSSRVRWPDEVLVRTLRKVSPSPEVPFGKRRRLNESSTLSCTTYFLSSAGVRPLGPVPEGEEPVSMDWEPIDDTPVVGQGPAPIGAGTRPEGTGLVLVQTLRKVRPPPDVPFGKRRRLNEPEAPVVTTHPSFSAEEEEDVVVDSEDSCNLEIPDPAPVILSQPPRRSARIAALRPPRRSARLAAKPRVCYKGMC